MQQDSTDRATPLAYASGRPSRRLNVVAVFAIAATAQLCLQLTFVLLRGTWFTNVVNNLLCYPVLPLLDLLGMPPYRWRELPALVANAAFWGLVVAGLFRVIRARRRLAA